jgi:hypothetical protein
MPRPTNKEELLKTAKETFDKLLPIISSNITFDTKISEGGKESHWNRDKNTRDVLVHLYEWHNLLTEWVSSNINGKTRSFLPEPYTWKSYGEMNIEFCKKASKHFF